MRGGGGEAVKLRKVLFARQHQFGRGKRVRKLARLFGDLPGIDADESDREQDAEPDTHHVDRRQLQRVVDVPRQRVVHENENGRAGDGKAAENQRETGRQRGCREQNRTEKKECKGILQSASQEQKHRQFGNIECEQPSCTIGLEALRDVKTEPQCDVEPGRQSDHAKAGVDRQLELQTVIDDEHGGRLADDREPA